MIQNCPNPRCRSPYFRKFGTFRRASDGKLVKRFTCLHCHLHFSSSTFTSTYRQHKRRANPRVFQLLNSGVSQRRIALLLNLHRTTVARKLAFLAREHTKCKPLSISLAVEAPSRRILGFEVSEALEQHLWVYMDFHNRVLLKGRKARAAGDGGPGGLDGTEG